MALSKVYPTRPLDCWPRMKELRREHYRNSVAAQESGGTVVVGIVEQGVTLLAGLGDYALWQYEPRFTACMRTHAEAAKNVDAFENHGFGRDLCSALRLHLGGALRGHLDEALKGHQPAFIYQWEACPTLIKAAQFMGERLGVPVLSIDLIGRYRPGPPDVEYLVDQMQDVIERMERITGRPYDDERLIEATRNEWDCTVLWAEICELTKRVPSPIDYRHMQGLRLPMIIRKDLPQVVAFYRDVLDEVKDRVNEGISARGFEEARLLLEGLIPLHHIDILRWPERYGATFIGSAFSFTGFGCWSMDEEGRWTVARRWWERGHPLKTREDALRALADLYIGNETERRPYGNIWDVRTRPQELMWRIKDWQVQGVVMGIDRQCPPQSMAQVEQMLVMQNHGIPCTDFAPCFSDPQQYDEGQTYNRVSALLEGMGLRKINAE